MGNSGFNPTTGPGSNAGVTGFTDHVKDFKTRLTYMQARHYDPALGRFLSIDPVTFMDNQNPSFFNRYRYCANDTVNCTDPTGMYDFTFMAELNVGASPSQARASVAAQNASSLKGAAAVSAVTVGVVAAVYAAPIVAATGLTGGSASVATTAVQSGGIAAAHSTINQGVTNNGDINYTQVAVDAGTSAVSAGVSRGKGVGASPSSPGSASMVDTATIALGAGGAFVAADAAGASMGETAENVGMGALGALHPAAQIGAAVLDTAIDYNQREEQ